LCGGVFISPQLMFHHSFSYRSHVIVTAHTNTNPSLYLHSSLLSIHLSHTQIHLHLHLHLHLQLNLIGTCDEIGRRCDQIIRFISKEIDRWSVKTNKLKKDISALEIQIKQAKEEKSVLVLSSPIPVTAEVTSEVTATVTATSSGAMEIEESVVPIAVSSTIATDSTSTTPVTPTVPTTPGTTTTTSTSTSTTTKASSTYDLQVKLNSLIECLQQQYEPGELYSNQSIIPYPSSRSTESGMSSSSEYLYLERLQRWKAIEIEATAASSTATNDDSSGIGSSTTANSTTTSTTTTATATTTVPSMMDIERSLKEKDACETGIGNNGTNANADVDTDIDTNKPVEPYTGPITAGLSISNNNTSGNHNRIICYSLAAAATATETGTATGKKSKSNPVTPPPPHTHTHEEFSIELALKHMRRVGGYGDLRSIGIVVNPLNPNGATATTTPIEKDSKAKVTTATVGSGDIDVDEKQPQPKGAGTKKTGPGSRGGGSGKSSTTGTGNGVGVKRKVADGTSATKGRKKSNVNAVNVNSNGGVSSTTTPVQSDLEAGNVAVISKTQIKPPRDPQADVINQNKIYIMYNGSLERVTWERATKPGSSDVIFIRTGYVAEVPNEMLLMEQPTPEAQAQAPATAA
jgi:hypothetical protein